MASVMKELQESSHLYGANAPFVEELYERYLEDPSSVARVVEGAVRRSGRRAGKGKDVAHSPVIAAFEKLARKAHAGARRRGRARAATTRR